MTALIVPIRILAARATMMRQGHYAKTKAKSVRVVSKTPQSRNGIRSSRHAMTDLAYATRMFRDLLTLQALFLQL